MTQLFTLSLRFGAYGETFILSFKQFSLFLQKTFSQLYVKIHCLLNFDNFPDTVGVNSSIVVTVKMK